MKPKRNIISMPVPKIGNNSQKLFDPTQAVQLNCECGSEYFDKVFKIGTISKLAPGNKSNQTIVLELPIYICHECSKELKPLPEENQNNSI